MMSRLLILAWMPNDVARLRIGFVVSKRISKRAVERNYIKRLLSEAIRTALPRLGVGLDIVVSARQQAGTADLSYPGLSKHPVVSIAFFVPVHTLMLALRL